MKDHEIIELYWARNESAIAATAEKYGNYCHTIAYNILRSKEDAEECANDTYLGAWNSIPPQRPSRLSIYLGKIARNLALNRYKRYTAEKRGHGQVVLALSELEACVPSETTVEQTIEENELAAAIDRFLYAKPKLNRNIFVRRYYHLYAIRDIADAYGMSESKVTSLLFRMRNELRRFLEKEGIMLMQDFSRFVPNVHFEQIPIKNLVSNQEYQRPLSQAQVEKAIEDFDLNQINPVKVSRRDGVNYVFNGQHTIEIVATVSGSRETPVWCMIYDSLDYKNEADIFANQMKHVRPLKPYEIFMANIEAGNEQQLVIKRLVESYSLSIGPTKAYGVICAVATLERIYTKYGYHVLDRTLRLCVGTWEGDIDSLGANVLAGVARMVVAFGDQLRDETFKERVGFMSVRQLSRIAKERGAGSLCYAEAMLVAYNRKCKYTLRMTKLHSGKVAAEDDFVEENEEPLADDPVLEE